ncbi:hypothetical protein AYO40_01615 [Planctomycetaceae bacterium SCGC AG-212-D15]|nr:hypothetical protein AYO40_01615 [Planctomycetaceae bacterium SCGC AG-212-D15]
MLQRPSSPGCLVSLSCALLLGCGAAGGDYQEVSGLVTFQGEPISDGSIQFLTGDTQLAPVGGSMIRDGEYLLPQDHGLKPGTYVVRISAPQRVPNPHREDEMSPAFLSRERIPATFNTKSTLRIEVRAGEPSQFDFDLQ